MCKTQTQHWIWQRHLKCVPEITLHVEYGLYMIYTKSCHLYHKQSGGEVYFLTSS